VLTLSVLIGGITLLAQFLVELERCSQPRTGRDTSFSESRVARYRDNGLVE